MERQKAELEQRLLQYQEEMRAANDALRRFVAVAFLKINDGSVTLQLVFIMCVCV